MPVAFAVLTADRQAIDDLVGHIVAPEGLYYLFGLALRAADPVSASRPCLLLLQTPRFDAVTAVGVLALRCKDGIAVDFHAD